MAKEHIIIDSQRNIFVPESLKKIGVQFDHNVNTLTFDCPRYWDGHDLSAMDISINYRLSNTDIYECSATDVAVDSADSTLMHFNWVISSSVTMVAGPLDFMVCIKKSDDLGEIRHWNSTVNSDLYVAAGLDCREGNGVLVLDLYLEDFGNDIVRLDVIVRGLSDTVSGLAIRVNGNNVTAYDAHYGEGAWNELIASKPNWNIITT